VSQYRLDVMSDGCQTPLAREFFETDEDDGVITEEARRRLRPLITDLQSQYGELYTPEGYYGQVELSATPPAHRGPVPDPHERTR
jgi:hypothetical protein